MAEGDSVFAEIINAPATQNPSITVHTHKDNLKPVMYKFRVAAVNVVGEGPMSDSIRVIAADMP